MWCFLIKKKYFGNSRRANVDVIFFFNANSIIWISNAQGTCLNSIHMKLDKSEWNGNVTKSLFVVFFALDLEYVLINYLKKTDLKVKNQTFRFRNHDSPITTLHNSHVHHDRGKNVWRESVVRQHQHTHRTRKPTSVILARTRGQTHRPSATVSLVLIHI